MDKKKIKRSGIREITWVHKAFLIAFVDILLILAAYLLALILRFDFIFSRIPQEYIEGYIWSMPYWIDPGWRASPPCYAGIIPTGKGGR